jgi:hypothetical protein
VDSSFQIISLYRAIESAKAGEPKTIRDMSRADRAAYNREAKRRSRQRAKESADNGRPEPTAAMVREALADAAIMLLATGGPGSAEIRHAIFKAFPGRAGVAGSVAAKARSGKLRPKVLTPERLRGDA